MVYSAGRTLWSGLWFGIWSNIKVSDQRQRRYDWYIMRTSAQLKHMLTPSLVRLWSMNTFSGLVSYTAHNYPVWCVAYSPAGVYFATGSHDKTARLWNTEHISCLRIFAGHLSDVDVTHIFPLLNHTETCIVRRVPPQLELLVHRFFRQDQSHVGPTRWKLCPSLHWAYRAIVLSLRIARWKTFCKYRRGRACSCIWYHVWSTNRVSEDGGRSQVCRRIQLRQ